MSLFNILKSIASGEIKIKKIAPRTIGLMITPRTSPNFIQNLLNKKRDLLKNKAIIRKIIDKNKKI